MRQQISTALQAVALGFLAYQAARYLRWLYLRERTQLVFDVAEHVRWSQAANEPPAPPDPPLDLDLTGAPGAP